MPIIQGSRKRPMTPQEIRSQLERILCSDRFASSPQLSQFLQFVVEETLADRAEQIKQYTIAVKALGHNADFDPQLNPVVRMQARRLRRALHHYYRHDGQTDPILITIPVGTYVPNFSFNAPDENATERNALSSANPTPTLLPGQQNSAPSGAQPDRERVALAVLPFLNLDDDARHVRIAMGLADEIVIALTHFADLRVVGALSRERMLQDNTDIQQIGQQYGIRFMVDGTVHWAEEQLQLGAKLLDTQTREYIWAQRYQRPLTGNSLANLITTVATEVAITIASDYGPIWQHMAQELRQKPAESLTSLEARLQAVSYFYLDDQSPATYRYAVETLERAMQLDPDSPSVLAHLAGLYVDGYVLLYTDHIPPQTSEYLRRARRLDPLNPQIHHISAYCAYHLGDVNGFRRAAARALELNPHATMVGELGQLYILVGEEARGQALVEQVMRQHPHYPSFFHYAPALVYGRRGDYAAALAEAQQVHVASPWKWLLRAALFGHTDQLAEAEHALAELFALRPDFTENGAALMSRAVGELDMPWLLAGLAKAGLHIRHA